MRSTSICFVVVATVCALLAHPLTVSAQAAPIIFTECSAGSIWTVTSIIGEPPSYGPQGTGIETIIIFTSTESVTSGSYNVTQAGQWNNQYSDPLYYVSAMPIGAGQGSLTPLLDVGSGFTNFTLTAYDQDQRQIMCVTFDYYLESMISARQNVRARTRVHNKKISPHHLRSSRQQQQQHLMKHTNVDATASSHREMPRSPRRRHISITVTA